VVAPRLLASHAPFLSYAFTVITSTWLGIDALDTSEPRKPLMNGPFNETTAACLARFEMRLPVALLAKIDAIRGETSRASFMRGLAEEELKRRATEARKSQARG
jgi:hypothetical protein